MVKVFELWYRREYENREDTEIRIGLYSTEEEAKAAIERLRDKPGFRDGVEGFEILSTTLNRDCFTEGFKTVYGRPPKDAQREAFDLPYWVDTGPVKTE